MNVMANVSDASSLAATVERARVLLDEGDVIAAKVLAAHAYDDAKSAARLAERFKAGQGLVEKARRLQGDALLIESRAKIALAEQVDAAKAAGAMAERGRPKNADNGNVLTAEDLGLDRKEIHDARKLRDAEAKEPGIVERAIAARLAAGLEPKRADVRAIGTRTASKEERGLDFYPTPREAVHALMTVERFDRQVWEPACGNGAISRPMMEAGYDLVLSDIEDRGVCDRYGVVQSVADFLQTRRLGDGVDGLPIEGVADIVTNPPFGIVNPFIAHALREHKPRKVAMLLNLNAMCGADDEDRLFWMEVCPPARIWAFSRRLPMMHRDGWDGARTGSQMNTAWFVWEQGARPVTELRRLDWKKQAEQPVLPPLGEGAA